ncbi:uncharacterized protein [Lolium perenne]|uniref:uncharacterized protein n=1 Tax=Lolium perenne TaxID=4522 RepID=UPI0021EAC791|nr:uncharacterized protein LOC127342080 [Lolium perenne]
MGMHRPAVLSLLLLLLITLALLSPAARASESPQYTTVHAESDFEVRLYDDTVWMSAPSDHTSFHVATKLGFHRLFQYLMGANLNSSRIRMTTPILTSIVVPGEGALQSSTYFVRLYLPTQFQASPPVPLPELNLRPDMWPGHCIAVRSFSGYARDKNVVDEADKLAMSLSRSPWGNSTNYPSKNAYSIAQYNSPFRIIGRVNEVWFDVDCKSTSTGVEAY